MDVAHGGVVADGVALVVIVDAAEDVPRRGDEQKEQRAGDGLECAPASPLTGEKQVGNGCSDKEDGSNEALGKRGQSNAGIDPIEARGAIEFEPGDERVEGDEQEEAQLRLGNDEARKKKRADGGEYAEACIKTGARTPGAAGPEPREPGEAEHGQRVGQMRGEGIFAEDLVTGGNYPIGQRGLLDVADAVDLRGDQVAGIDHVLGGLGMGGVNIVEQRGRKEGCKLHGGKDGCQKQPDSDRGGRLAGAIDSLRVEPRFGGHR